MLSLAAILGVHTLVTSTQTYDGTGSKEGYNSKYNHRERSVNSNIPKRINTLMSACVCFLDVIKGEKMNPVFDEPPNPTNVEDTLQRIKSNDSSLTEVNLNNIKVRRNTSVYRVWLKAGVYLRTNGSVSVGFSEHSNSHAEGHRQSHGEQHTRQEVQHGGDTEQRPSRCGEMECLVCFLMTFVHNLLIIMFLKSLLYFPVPPPRRSVTCCGPTRRCEV